MSHTATTRRRSVAGALLAVAGLLVLTPATAGAASATHDATFTKGDGPAPVCNDLGVEGVVVDPTDHVAPDFAEALKQGGDHDYGTYEVAVSGNTVTITVGPNTTVGGDFCIKAASSAFIYSVPTTSGPVSITLPIKQEVSHYVPRLAVNSLSCGDSGYVEVADECSTPPTPPTPTPPTPTPPTPTPTPPTPTTPTPTPTPPTPTTPPSTPPTTPPPSTPSTPTTFEVASASFDASAQCAATDPAAQIRVAITNTADDTIDAVSIDVTDDQGSLVRTVTVPTSGLYAEVFAGHEGRTLTLTSDDADGSAVLVMSSDCDTTTVLGLEVEAEDGSTPEGEATPVEPETVVLDEQVEPEVLAQTGMDTPIIAALGLLMALLGAAMAGTGRRVNA